MMKIQVLSNSYLCFTDPPNAWAILVDPCNQWEMLSNFLKEKQIKLRYLLLTSPSFEKSLRVAQIRQETGAKFLSFQSDLLKLRQLPREADIYNVCGIKIPQVDRFLDGMDKIELDGVPVQVSVCGASRKYVVDGIEIPHES